MMVSSMVVPEVSKRAGYFSVISSSIFIPKHEAKQMTEEETTTIHPVAESIAYLVEKTTDNWIAAVALMAALYMHTTGVGTPDWLIAIVGLAANKWLSQ